MRRQELRSGDAAAGTSQSGDGRSARLGGEPHDGRPSHQQLPKSGRCHGRCCEHFAHVPPFSLQLMCERCCEHSALLPDKKGAP